ncbi:MAG TPA: LD-carboxypeptidase [Phycisphaerae bacterium]|nr:LD-carboxypeptidase [Phycisphaerae bacterium]HRR86546.1 LD-carboxypeptidase [Phycisphaerae bacterium]
MAAKPRIHLTAVASYATQGMQLLGIRNVGELIALASSRLNGRYAVTAGGPMIFAKQDEMHGGRFDDAARAREIETILADDDVAALVTVRGGSWFTRILQKIDFDVLKRRRTTIHVFGFSEMTSLVLIAGRYPKVFALHDLGPLFLFDGVRRFMTKRADAYLQAAEMPVDAAHCAGFGAGWAAAKFRGMFADFIAEVAAILDGHGSPRVPSGRLLEGKLPAAKPITIVGGNISVIMPLIGSRYAEFIDPTGKWLALEEINESVGAVDRMLAGLKLSGLLDKAEGIILGNFRDGDANLTQAVFEALKRHQRTSRNQPVIELTNFGHVYPIAPLPMHRQVILRCRRAARGQTQVSIETPWDKWGRE